MNRIDKPSRKSFDDRLQTMIDQLRSHIASGMYSSGTFLPSEKSLAEQFQLSNKSVRKGLDKLIEEGLIVKVDRVGSRVVESSPAAAVTLTLGISHTIERDIALSVLLEDFHSLHPSIRVKPSPLISDSNYTGAVKKFSDNGLIDVFTLNNLHFQDIVDKDELPMLQTFDHDALQYRFTQDAFVHHNRLYARPLVFSPIILAYNRAHFRQSRTPEPDGSWTWEEALRHAAALTVPGQRHGLYFYLLSDNRWPAFLLQGDVRFDSDRPFRAEDNRLLEAVRLCKRIISDRGLFPNYMSENSDDVNALFMQGKVSMIMTNYMTINDFRHTDLEYDISPLPYMHEPRALLNAIGVAVSAATKHGEAARLLADYLASPRAQLLIRKHTLSLPANKEAAESPAAANDGMNRPSRFYLFREIMASYRLHRELNISSASFVKLRQLLKSYWSGLIDDESLSSQAALLAEQQRE